MRGSEFSCTQSLLVERVHAIDEVTVPFLVGLEVVAKTAIDEDVDDVGEADVRAKMESVEQKRKDLLRPNTLEALAGTIPVLVKFLVAVELAVVTILGRQFLPEPVHRSQRFRPSLMAISADHVADDKATTRMQSAAYLVE